MRLARLLAAGELSFVFIPSVADEHFLHLVRAIDRGRPRRLDARAPSPRQVPVRRSERYPGPGRGWTARHVQWLRALSFRTPART
jgi:hypothetical protein